MENGDRRMKNGDWKGDWRQSGMRNSMGNEMKSGVKSGMETFQFALAHFAPPIRCCKFAPAHLPWSPAVVHVPLTICL